MSISFIAMPFIVISGIYERFSCSCKSSLFLFSRGIYHPLIFMLILYLLPDTVEKRLLMHCMSILLLCLISCISAIHGYFSGIKINNTPDYSDKLIWVQSGWLYTLSTLIIKGTPSMAIFLLERYGTDEKSVGFFSAIAALYYGYHLLTKPFDSYLKPSIANFITKMIQQPYR